MTLPAFPAKLLPLISLLLLLPRCEILVLSSNPAGSPYRSEHFTIYYPEAVFSGDEMVVIAERKERLLAHINEYLGTGYDGVIEVFVGDGITQPSARTDERVFETTYRVLIDNGHETAHVVTIHEWGVALSPFISEGAAEAASLSPEYPGNAMERFVERWQSELPRIASENLADSVLNDITKSGAFEYSRFEYDCAGAFMHYLKDRFGIKKVEIWYREAVVHSDISSHDATFLYTFGIPLNSVIADFVADVYSRI